MKGKTSKEPFLKWFFGICKNCKRLFASIGILNIFSILYIIGMINLTVFPIPLLIVSSVPLALTLLSIYYVIISYRSYKRK